MDLLQRLTEVIAPAADEPPPPSKPTGPACSIVHLGDRIPRPQELPPDRLLPSEIAALRAALNSKCPILRRIVESPPG